MLLHEWQELEQLSDRIAEMRDRCGAARRSNNVGLLFALKKEIEAATRQRENLIRHISARFGSIAA